MRSLKNAFTVSTSKLLRSISEVHKLNVPCAVSQELSVCTNLEEVFVTKGVMVSYKGRVGNVLQVFFQVSSKC